MVQSTQTDKENIDRDATKAAVLAPPRNGAENRKSQARFRCTKCGHTDNADANAARNHLLIRHVGEKAGRQRTD